MTKTEFLMSLYTFHSVLTIVTVLSKFFQHQNAILSSVSGLMAADSFMLYEGISLKFQKGKEQITEK